MLITQLKESLLGKYQHLEHYLNLRIATFLVLLAIGIARWGLYGLKITVLWKPFI